MSEVATGVQKIMEVIAIVSEVGGQRVWNKDFMRESSNHV